MAQGQGAIYNEFKLQIGLGTFNLGSGGNAFKVALVQGYTPNIDTHTTWADAVAQEVAGTGYTTRGQALTGQSYVKDNTNDRAVFDGTDILWTSLQLTTPANGIPSHAILYKDTGTNSTSYLVCYWEVTTATNGGNYGLQFNAVGILTVS